MSNSERQVGGRTGLASVVNRLNDRLNMRSVFLTYAVFVIVYIYAPIIALIAFSFNQGGVNLPFSAFTLDWYVELLNNSDLVASITRSLQLAVVVTVVTTILATMTALAYRYDFWGKKGLIYLLLVGIIVPGVTYGVGAALFFNDLLGLDKSLWLAIPVHVVWALPFAVIVLLAGFPSHLVKNGEAAQLMGASRWSTFREVLLPQIAPTVLGAAVFAFTLSFNESTRGLLLTGQDATMPQQVFAIASAEQISPDLFALGAATTIASTILLLFAAFLVFYGARTSS